MHRFLIALLFALFTLQMATPEVVARPRSAKFRKALQHFRKGESHYQQGNYALALRQYQIALKLAHRPSIIFNIAQCYRFLDQPEEAIRNYQLYLVDWSDLNGGNLPPNAAEVKEFIASEQQKLAQRNNPTPAPVAQPAQPSSQEAILSLTGVPPDAIVSVDGEQRQPGADFQLILTPGHHDLLVEAPGYRAWRQVVQLAAGSKRGLAIELVPQSEERSLAWLIAGISSGVLAIGGEALAITYTVKANGEYTDSDNFSTYRNVAIAGHVVAGVCAAFSAVSFYMYWRSGQQTRVALQPGVGGGVLSAAFSF